MIPPEKEDPYSVTELALNRKNAVVEVNNSVPDIKMTQIFQLTNELKVGLRGDGLHSNNTGGSCVGDGVQIPVNRYICWMFWNNRILPAMMAINGELDQSTIRLIHFIQTISYTYNFNFRGMAFLIGSIIRSKKNIEIGDAYNGNDTKLEIRNFSNYRNEISNYWNFPKTRNVYIYFEFLK